MKLVTEEKKKKLREMASPIPLADGFAEPSTLDGRPLAITAASFVSVKGNRRQQMSPGKTLLDVSGKKLLVR